MLPQKNKFINFLCLVLIVIFSASIFLHSDYAITQDLGRHLLLGKIIWQTKTVLSTNLLSYTHPDFPFTNHHWGASVLLFFMDTVSGINGLIIWKVLFVTWAIIILFLFTQKYSGNILVILSSILALEILRDRTQIRPEIFAYLFFAILLVSFYREKERKTRVFISLPLLQLIWVNLHVSFILGIALYGLFLLDRFLTKRITTSYIITGIFFTLASLVNPYFIHGALYPLKLFQNYGYSIVENQSPFFLETLMSNPSITYYKISLVLIVLLVPFLLRKKYFFETFVVLLTGGLSFFAIRHFPFFALSLVLPLSLGLKILTSKIVRFIRLTKPLILAFQLLATFTLVLIVIWESYGLISNKYYYDHFMAQRFGWGQVRGLKDTMDYYIAHDLSGPIFNNFDIGSYVVYRLYPNEKVFVDGRPEAYPASFFQDVYIPMQENKDIWLQVDKLYNFKTIVYGHTDATPWGKTFLSKIVDDPAWIIRYFDDYGIILTKINASNSYDKGSDNREFLRLLGTEKVSQENEPDALARLANLFYIAELPDLGNLTRLKAVQQARKT
ncbi:MAG TPA: hypothetical protein VJ184_06015 [Chryseolinea sp.]|nr:hypothetical protein [Chryseolinea sp.]